MNGRAGSGNAVPVLVLVWHHRIPLFGGMRIVVWMCKNNDALANGVTASSPCNILPLHNLLPLNEVEHFENISLEQGLFLTAVQ